MSDVTCAACGSAQSAGSAFCAVCGQPFPRTGRPVAAAPTGPVGSVQAFARSGADLPYAAPGRPDLDTTTEPEVYTATQKAFGAPPVLATSSLASAPLAGTGRRFVAFLVDVAVPAVLALVVLVAGLAVVGAPLGGVRTLTQEEASELLGRVVGVYALAGVLVLAWWVATWFWEGSTGKTLGNLLTGIRTLGTATREPLGFGRAALRWVVVGACGIVPFGSFVVALSPGFDSSGRSQGWHDKAARAVVVDVRGAAPSGYDGVAALVAPAGTGASPAPYGGHVRAPHPGGPAPAVHPGAPAAYPGAPAAYPGTSAAYPGGAPASASPQGYGPPAGFAPPAAPAPAPSTSDVPPAPAAPVPDPWAFPSAPDPADGGLITGVPGASSAPAAPPTPAAAPAPAPATAPTSAGVPTSSPAPARAPAPVPEPEPEWDSTRMTARDARSMDPAPDVVVVLELESGERRPVDRPTLLGRNPQAPDDGPWNLVAVDDPTRSVSKTHAELRADPSGLWLTDRGSTNGTVVSVPGMPPRVAEPGVRVRVPVGATIHVGDRRIVVHPGAA